MTRKTVMDDDSDDLSLLSEDEELVFGFWATKEGGIMPSIKRRYFRAEPGRKRITYWATEEAAHAFGGRPDDQYAKSTLLLPGNPEYKGTIHVAAVEEMSNRAVVVRDESGRVFHLQPEDPGIVDVLTQHFSADAKLTLEAVLADEQLAAEYHKFLQRHYCEESIEFYFAVCQYERSLDMGIAQKM